MGYGAVNRTLPTIEMQGAACRTVQRLRFSSIYLGRAGIKRKHGLRDILDT
jgi:hypothetical protein